MSRRGTAIHRVDLTAKALIVAAKALGCQYHAQDATVDGILWLPSGRIVEIDWKSPGADLTPAQAKLIAAGWKIEFISTPQQLEGLVKSESKRR